MPNLRVEVRPEVYGEMEAARSWYEEKAQNLGNEFIETVSAAIRLISDSPETWPFFDDKLNVRRFLIRRFPFAILYRKRKDDIQVVAVMHVRRKPAYWKTRIQ